MSLTVWEYNGNRYPYDLQDADVMEHYEQTVVKLREWEKDLPKEGASSEIMRAYCGMFVRFFDEIFGTGEGGKIIKNAHSVRDCEEAYVSFLDYVAAQGTERNEHRASLRERYSMNRAQRRAAERAK